MNPGESPGFRGDPASDLSVGCSGAKFKRLTMYVVISMVLSSDAGSTPAISTEDTPSRFAGGRFLSPAIFSTS